MAGRSSLRLAKQCLNRATTPRGSFAGGLNEGEKDPTCHTAVSQHVGVPLSATFDSRASLYGFAANAEPLDSDAVKLLSSHKDDCLQLTKKKLTNHLKTSCNLQLRDCDYREHGCHFRGNIEELTKHDREQAAYHIQLLKQANKKLEKTYSTKLQKMDQTLAAVKNQLADIHLEVCAKIQPVIDAVIKLEPTIQQMQEGFNEMALMVQTLQDTSYNGTFIWKVPEVQRRRDDAKIGKTISLYSAPFYTSRHGYKLCLRLYMDGDGVGKSTHISFFLTIMRGDFDALLQWPFKQPVTLTLLDQDKAKNIVQSFRPEPTSSSFQRPQSEMNVASGCPLFAPLTVLNNSSYVEQDTMFLKCETDCSDR